MRAVLIAVAAAVLGVVAAWGATKVEFRRPESPLAIAKTPVKPGHPRVEVEGGKTFDFGVMEVYTTKKHTFVIRNVGAAPLTLTKGHTTCKCTISDVSGEPVPPGESREVHLEWTPKSTDQVFQQTAEINTNDPDHNPVQLIIRGQVRESVRVEPSAVQLGQFSSSDDHTFEVKVWNYRELPWQLKGYTCVRSETADHFSLEARDMTPQELGEGEGAAGGQVLRLVVKAGLPLGNVQQTLRIEHNYEERGAIDLDVVGKVVGDITTLGRDYDFEHDFVELGNVPAQHGKKSSLFLVVKGAHRDDVKITLKSVDPASSLKVEVGKPTGQGGRAVLWPINLEIPAGAEPVNRLGSELGRLARVEVETTHPDIPLFTLKIRFAVTNDE